MTKNALVVYWSKTGNTKKVALAIKQGLELAGVKVDVMNPEEAAEADYFDHNLLCVGSPSYYFLPAEPITNFLKRKFSSYRKQGQIKVASPKVPGRNAMVFVTFSGPHTAWMKRQQQGNIYLNSFPTWVST